MTDTSRPDTSRPDTSRPDTSRPDTSQPASAVGDQSPPAPARPIVAGNARVGRDRGQATTEYALVLLAAALVGVLVVGWATAGGGAAAIGGLFDRVIQSVMDQL
jgi:hypothetical protein